MYVVYAMIPFDRGRAEAEKQKEAYKHLENGGERFEQLIEQKRRELGTDQNVFVRYLGWLGIAPINGNYNGILQGNLGYSYEYSKPAKDVLAEPMKNTIFINRVGFVVDATLFHISRIDHFFTGFG